MFDKHPAEFALLAAFVLAFTHFLAGGARTFKWAEGDELAAGMAQLSFFVTGGMGTMFLAFRASVALWNGIAA